MKYYSKYKFSNNYTLYSLVKIVILLLIGAVMVYGLNNPFARMLYYGSIILIILFSKDTVFTIALLFILVSNPFGLFYTSPYNWILGLTSTVGVLYSHVFAIAIFFKFLFNDLWRKYLIKDYMAKQYKYFSFYVIFLLIWGLIFGHSSKSAYDLVTTITVFSMFYVLTKVFVLDEFHLFNRIIFGFCLIYTIGSGFEIILSGGVSKFLFFETLARGPAVTENLVRIFGGVWLALYSLVFSLYYITNRKKFFNYYYLLLVAISSLLVLINSGTRGWILGSLLFVVVYLIYYGSKKRISGRFFLGAFIIGFLGLIILPENIKHNIKGSFDRVSTVKYVAEGDMTAGGTASRWDVRGPKVMEKFNESPVFGYGFSKVTSDYFDPHVGNHTVLLMGGVIGISILYITVIKIIFFFLRLERSNKNFLGIFIFSFGLLGILIIHSTNMIMLSFVKMPITSAFMIALIFNFINAQIESQQKINM